MGESASSITEEQQPSVSTEYEEVKEPQPSVSTEYHETATATEIITGQSGRQIQKFQLTNQ